jgi:hypothetical protein
MGKFPAMPLEVVQAMKSRAPYAISPSRIYDLHHSILSKGDLMGTDDSEKAKIHSVYNLLKLPHEYHASHANIPTREEALKELIEREGYENVRDWYLGIQFKNPPFLFPEKGEL